MARSLDACVGVRDDELNRSETRAETTATEPRKTPDVCGNVYAGARCIKQRGHDGRHECVSRAGEHQHALRWD